MCERFWVKVRNIYIFFFVITITDLTSNVMHRFYNIFGNSDITILDLKSKFIYNIAIDTIYVYHKLFKV